MLCSSKDVGEEVMVEWRKRDGLRKFVVVREGRRTERGSKARKALVYCHGQRGDLPSPGFGLGYLGLAPNFFFRKDQEAGRSSRLS
jgi:hypothetical protein